MPFFLLCFPMNKSIIHSFTWMHPYILFWYMDVLILCILICFWGQSLKQMIFYLQRRFPKHHGRVMDTSRRSSCSCMKCWMLWIFAPDASRRSSGSCMKCWMLWTFAPATSRWYNGPCMKCWMLWIVENLMCVESWYVLTYLDQYQRPSVILTLF